MLKKIISKLVRFIKKLFGKHEKQQRQNFLEPNSAEERDKQIRKLLAQKEPRKCGKCGKSDIPLSYDPTRKTYFCDDCWKDDDNNDSKKQEDT